MGKEGCSAAKHGTFDVVVPFFGTIVSLLRRSPLFNNAELPSCVAWQTRYYNWVLVPIAARRGLAGWPKLHFQVWSQDIHGRNDICK